MNERVLKRFVVLMGLLLLVTVIAWPFMENFLRQEPGDYHTKQGDQQLTSGEFDLALKSFDLALQEMPDHRGALMGRALVFIQTERYAEAVEELTYLIGRLEETLEPDDTTGRGALAAAYANRGVVHDREARYEEALFDYVRSLQVDEGVTEGPGIFDQILYGYRPSTVRDRAIYLQEQLRLPEDQRVMRVPEKDELQRMHKP
ncbi:MAG: tetratricopeptide repeat protein [Kiloniellales bacterium]|nr:tetratricopeptide repeat protein [Kiloniellales bacterium]